ncbi:MAG: DUF2277 domain-containing protein [Betaproteobacteria bacterium]|nr:MAG: DUF2277 domain-containing protein [Betaproteobacteria bacterium]
MQFVRKLTGFNKPSKGAAHAAGVWEQNIDPGGRIRGGRPWSQTFEQGRSWKDWKWLQEMGFLTAVLSCAAARHSRQP